MNLYIDQGGGPGKTYEGEPDHRRPFRVWGTVTRETEKFYYVTRAGLLTSETRRISKDRMSTGGQFARPLYTEAQMEDEVWLRTYRGRVSSAVSRADVATLKKLAELLGVWKP